MLNKKADKRAEDALTYDDKGNRLCPDHKNRYLLVPEDHPSYTGLCGHPDCIGKMISALVNRSKVWKGRVKLFHELQIWEDFVAYIYEELLKEALKGKPTIINPTWFRFKMLSFTHQELKRGYAVLSKVPRHYRNNYQGIISNWDREFLDREYSHYKESLEGRQSLEDTLFDKEILDFVESKWGSEWVLFLTGEITQFELAKLYKIPVNKVKRREKAVFRSLISHFCDEERRNELWETMGLDGDTPLKNIIVDVKNEGSVKGGNQKMYQQYWETLADKINNSTGLSYWDKKNMAKKNQLEAELAELNKQMEDRNVSSKVEETTT